MNIDERIKAFARLGDFFQNISQEQFQTLATKVRNENPWFTEDSVKRALTGVSLFLDEEKLANWTKAYDLPPAQKKVAIVMAGNIPMVGFHDLLCVLMSGNAALIKLSSKDSVLMNFAIEKLIEIEPRFSAKAVIAERLKDFDAVIATGSDNTSRYFDYYFGKYPHIIRRNRTSVAILSGTETSEDLRALGDDVFTYYGLGCRNVSKLFVPENYSFDYLFENWEKFGQIIHHHKYCNNYDYQKSILLVDRQPFLDNGFVMLRESERFVSPISVVYFQYYQKEESLKESLNAAAEKIQVVIGNSPLCNVPFGAAQYPPVSDYADNMDTMKFLADLKNKG